MSNLSQFFEAYRKIVEGVEMPAEEEGDVVRRIARTDPAALQGLVSALSTERRRLRAELTETKENLARLFRPPLYPATVLRVCGDGRLDVVAGGRRQIVASAPELWKTTVRRGNEVLLDSGLAVAVAHGDHSCESGHVGTVVEILGQSAVVRTVADDEVVADCAADLAASLKAGDRVVYRPEIPHVVARLESTAKNPHAVNEPPPVTFDDIGGLDNLIAEIRADLDLHLLHPDLVREYRLRLLRGITLAGRPGVGKNLIAGAIANYLNAKRGALFFDVKPGSLRGVFYGQAEGRIRDLFAAARAASSLAVVFFDELDTFGARGVSPAACIDDRVLGALLAEIAGLRPADNVLCIGATNRLDLCDEAMLRAGRFGDRIYTVPRPNRQAARDIFGKYLPAGLPYAKSGDHQLQPAELIEAATAYLFAPHGAGPLATVTLADGQQQDVPAAAVASGALIASVAERAKHAAASRRAAGGAGELLLEDLLAALDQALDAEFSKLHSPMAARRVLDFRGADQIARVDPPAHRVRCHQYLRAA